MQHETPVSPTHSNSTATEDAIYDGIINNITLADPAYNAQSLEQRMAWVPEADNHSTIFITDLEGNGENLVNVVAQYAKHDSPLFWLPPFSNERPPNFALPTSAAARLDLKPGYHLVFGGDMQGKGYADIRCTKIFVDLAARYPDRVTLLVGNRDICTMRFPAELQPAFLDSPASYDNPAFPYWVPQHNNPTLKQWAEPKQLDPKSREARVRYMLDKTMGSEGAFDRRRLELAIITNRDPLSVAVDEVVDSYLNQVHPAANDPFMLNYLRMAQIMHIDGPTLYVHGAIKDTNMQTMPHSSKYPKQADLKAWVAALNAWYKKQIKEFESNPEHGSITLARAAYGIMDYTVPGPNMHTSVVIGSNLVQGAPCLPSSSVANLLRSAGVYTVMSGHTPNGTTPLVIRSNEFGVNLVVADTSYSNSGGQVAVKPQVGFSCTVEDNRGAAAAAIIIHTDGTVSVYGTRDGKDTYQFVVPTHNPTPRPLVGYHDYTVGRPTNPKWIRTPLEDGTVLLSEHDGYKITYSTATAPARV